MPKLIGIAGETASGKSTLCDHLLNRTPPGLLRVVCLDSYYRSQGHLPVHERTKVNYDHPEAIDIALLVDHLDALCQGNSIHLPVYDFCSHERLAETIEVPCAPVVVVEGILALYWEDLRRRYAFKVYVDAPEQLRMERRIARDTVHRGRTRESVVDQWKNSVQRMSQMFCLPTKQCADLIVNGENPDAADFERLLKKMIA